MLLDNRSAPAARTTVYYRFQVTDPRTGEPYVITLSEEGSPIESIDTGKPFDQCFDVSYDQSDVPCLVPSMAGR